MRLMMRIAGGTIPRGLEDQSLVGGCLAPVIFESNCREFLFYMFASAYEVN